MSDRETMSAQAIGFLPSILAMAWLVSKAQIFWRDDPNLQFGWLVVLLCGYLILDAWPTRPPRQFRFRGIGILLGIIGLTLLFFIQVYQAGFGLTATSVTGLAFGVFLVVAANLHFLFGWAGVRHFWFGVVFILLALPTPAIIHSSVVMGLQTKVASVNVDILNLLGIPAEKIGNLIRLQNCTIGVDEACSGVRSLQSTLMATLFIGYLTLSRKSLRLLLLVVGLALAVLGNLIRSFFLSYAASLQGTEAVNNFHDTAGWSILAFTAAGVMLLSWRLHRWEAEWAKQKMSGPLSIG